MANVLDVSRYILEDCGEMTTMKLQKLSYYCQAYSLASFDNSLFQEDFEAWANGPVCTTLYSQHKGRFAISSLGAGDTATLSEKEQDLIKRVCSRLNLLSGSELSQRTHDEDPWKNARGDFPSHARGSEIITKEAMKAYYKKNPFI